MRKKKERLLTELYDLTAQIVEPEITPVLKGSCRIQGPMDEADNDLPVNSVDSKKRSPKHFVNENVHTRAVSGTCNVCSAPCSSCMHHSKAESVVESKVEDAFRENNLSRKEADNFSSINSEATAFYKSRVCDDGEHVASEGSNFFSESSSHDSFSENAESKTAVRIPDTCDVSEGVDMPTKAFPHKSIVEVGLQPKASIAQNVNTQGLLSSAMISDSLPRKASFQDEEKHVLGSHGDNVSCISRSVGVNIAIGHLNIDLERKNMPCISTLTSDLPSKNPKNLKIQTACGSNAETEPNSRSSGDYADESLKKYSGSGSAIDVFPGKPDPSCMSSQIKNSSFGVTNSKDLEERPCFQPLGEPSESSLKQEKSILADTSVVKTGDGRSVATGSVDILLEIGERKSSPSLSGKLPDTDKNSHKSVKEGVPADSGNSSDQLIKSDVMKQENRNTTTDSKLCEHGLAKSESSSGTGKDTKKIVKDSLNADCGNSSDQPSKSDMVKEENGNSAIEPDLLEDDVKICDICGDAGREDLLAICSKCSDGAEHTYCMRIMLDKIPEGDWLCEECKFKEDAESKKVVKPEAVCGMLREPSFNKSRQDFGNTNSINPKDLPKLDNKTLAATKSVKGLPNLQVASARLADNVEITTTSNRKASEIKSPSAMPSVIGSPKKVLSRESSSKSLDAVKVRPSEVSLLSANSSQAQGHALTSSNHSLSSIQARYHSPRGSLSKSSFDNMKPKVKLVTEHIPQKTKSFDDPTRVDAKKEINRMIDKSASFKGMGRSRSSIDSTCKLQHISRTDDTRSLTQGKEKSFVESRNSFVTDRPHSSPLLPTVTSISSKKDVKAASHDGKLSDPSEANILLANKGADDARDLVMLNEKKQQSSYSEKSCPPNGVFTSEDQKPTRGGPSASTTTDKLCDPVVQQSAGREVKNRPISSSNLRQAVPAGGKLLKCQRCNETGHATQCCSIDKIRLTALKPSGERNLVNKTNKWKDTVEAAVSKARFNNTNRLSDKPDRLPLSCASLSRKISTKDQLLDVSGRFKNLTPLEGTTDIEESSRSFTNNSDKTALQNDVKQKAPLPMEPAHASKSGESIINADALKSEPLMEILPGKASMHSSPSRASAFPETCHIWQGSFEVHWTGSLCNLHDGVQAHLSSCASPKVLEVATNFPCKVQLEEASCVNSWPSQFHQKSPIEENIALFFFATDFDSYEKSYKKLVDKMMKNDLVLKGSVDGAELLIFPSNKLPKRAQCWNGFNYLWCVLRAKKSNCSERVPDCQKKPCEFSSDAEHRGPDFPPLSADISALEKVNSCEPVIEESSTCHMRVKMDEDELKPTTSMNSENMLCGSKNMSFDLNENSHDDKPLEEAALDNNFPLKKQRIHSSPESISVSMTKETSVPGNCSELVGVSAVQLHPDMKENTAPSVEVIQHPWGETNELANVKTVARFSENRTSFPQLLAGKGKGLDTLPGPTVVPQTKLSVQGTAAEREKTKTSEILIDLEASPESLPLESIVHEEHFCWGPRLNIKRTSSYSQEPVYQASSEALARESMPWKEKKILLSDENKVPKKLKLYHGEHTLDNELADYCSSERHFFPVSTGDFTEPKPANIGPSLIVSLDNDDGPNPDIPNLELALGGEKDKQSQKILPLILSLAETDHAKPLDSVLHQDDGPASLSLSLAFPSPENATSSKGTEQHLSERPNLNSLPNLKSSLLLFGGVIDSGKH